VANSKAIGVLELIFHLPDTDTTSSLYIAMGRFQHAENNRKYVTVSIASSWKVAIQFPIAL